MVADSSHFDQPAGFFERRVGTFYPHDQAFTSTGKTVDCTCLVEVRPIMRFYSVHATDVTRIAAFAFLAAGCSQRGPSQSETTTEPLLSVAPATGTTAVPVAPSTPIADTTAGPSSLTSPVDPAASTVGETQVAPVPSTDATSAASETTTEPQVTCIPPEPTVVRCADNLNEDEPQTPCSQWVEWGTCDESWMLERHVCDRSCGRCEGDEIIATTPAVNTCEMSSEAPPSSTGGPPVMNQGPKLPPIEGGELGFTTRYWDCCKPHCGWPGNSGRPISSCDQNNNNMGGDHNAGSACNGGPAHMCWNFVPKTNGDNIAYAFAAHNGVGCGTCFQFDFTGESHNPKPETGHDFGSQSLAGKSMIVQVINTGGIEAGQFDLLVPGGGVGEFNACSNQWGGAELGEQYGGFFLACQKEHNFEYEPARQCAREWCDRVFSDKPELLEGCSWFVEWFALADNPTMRYKEVPCPQELTSISGL